MLPDDFPIQAERGQPPILVNCIDVVETWVVVHAAPEVPPKIHAVSRRLLR